MIMLNQLLKNKDTEPIHEIFVFVLPTTIKLIVNSV
jgi:hypothetical protein